MFFRGVQTDFVLKELEQKVGILVKRVNKKFKSELAPGKKIYEIRIRPPDKGPRSIDFLAKSVHYAQLLTFIPLYDGALLEYFQEQCSALKIEQRNKDEYLNTMTSLRHLFSSGFLTIEFALMLFGRNAFPANSVLAYYRTKGMPFPVEVWRKPIESVQSYLLFCFPRYSSQLLDVSLKISAEDVLSVCTIALFMKQTLCSKALKSFKLIYVEASETNAECRKVFRCIRDGMLAKPPEYPFNSLRLTLLVQLDAEKDILAFMPWLRSKYLKLDAGIRPNVVHVDRDGDYIFTQPFTSPGLKRIKNYYYKLKRNIR